MESLWNDTIVTFVVFLTSLKRSLGLFGFFKLQQELIRFAIFRHPLPSCLMYLVWYFTSSFLFVL